MEERVIAALWLLQANDPVKDVGRVGSSGLMEYLKLLMVLGLILALAFFVLRVGLPRIRGFQRPVTGAIQVAAEYPLESNKHLYVIRIGRAHMLLGTTDSAMHFLTALEAADIESAMAEADPPHREFAGLMQAFRRRKNSSSL
jgi:flagellar biogenesis protein FliO